MTVLTLAQVRALRLRALLLTGARGLVLDGGASAVACVVEHLGAMQAQDVASARWSLGVRLPGTPQAEVVAAIDRGYVLRTWPMRGTIHLVPSRDAAWMTALMSRRPRAAAASRRAALGLTDADVARGTEALREALTGTRLTRAACLAALDEAGVSPAGQRGYHVIVDAAQSGAVCLAGEEGKEQLFARLDEWAPDPAHPSRDEGLATLATRFVRSHGPVTERDFARWTGLPLRDCRAGIAGAEASVEAVETEAGPMLVAPAALEEPAVDLEDLALPGFDELVLGYADRSAQLDKAHEPSVVPGGNGVFRSTFVLDGRVVGTWRRTLRAHSVEVEAHDIVGLSRRDRQRCERALSPFGAFVGLPVTVTWATPPRQRARS
ncbi:winged helix DNA-binding domain-containing protein [Demequina subtropica]|uniref:winged helix DNA-binding domain-containing protein n=1 Tax=Demequina subtropica TaxID=1638989 RepID=UPI000783E9E4|nr:winged helix DNA-binding domain-containing protein [Demequina subtropica]